jgi:hypothetical protein
MEEKYNLGHNLGISKNGEDIYLKKEPILLFMNLSGRFIKSGLGLS